LYENFKENEQPFVTFIIPSIGRKSIDIPLQSLINQTYKNWEAIVIYDGVKPKKPNIKDNRIKIVYGKKYGNAGQVRNHGIKMANTPWIAFLDDDDAVSPIYIERLHEMIQTNNNADIFIFRYIYNMNLPDRFNISPPPETRNIIHAGRVGISFCAKKMVFENVSFTPDFGEDFTLLSDALKKSFNIVMSKYVTYVVRPVMENVKSDAFWNIINRMEYSTQSIQETKGTASEIPR
jgi:glycosyltransferase involved in cell wall biosynthesis